VRERHSAYAYPREIEFVDDLPKTLTGKIRRVELREAEREKKQSETAAAAAATPSLAPPQGR
jgi:acyl-coenzyme A synthetase/AMP-(fatty) acid ligase